MCGGEGESEENGLGKVGVKGEDEGKDRDKGK